MSDSLASRMVCLADCRALIAKSEGRCLLCQDLSIVRVVGGHSLLVVFLKHEEEPHEISDGADCEPDRGHNADEQGERQCVVEEEVDPGILGPAPGGNQVPEELDEEDEEGVACPDEDRVRQDSVALGVFLVDARDLRPREPLLGFPGGPCDEVLQVVFAAMEHPVQVEGLLVGQQGDEHVAQHREDDSDEVDFLPSDREFSCKFHWVGIPLDDWEGVADALKGLPETLQELREAGAEPWMDGGPPVLAQIAAQDCEEAADYHRRVCARGRPALPVEASDDAGAGAGQEDRARQGHVLEDEVPLPEEEAEEPREHRDPEDREAQKQYLGAKPEVLEEIREKIFAKKRIFDSEVRNKLDAIGYQEALLPRKEG